MQRLFHNKTRDKTLELAKPPQDVLRNSLSQHMNGRGIASVVIYGNVADLDMDKEEADPSDATI